MLAKEIIKQVRDSTNLLWQEYLEQKESGLEIACSNPEELYKKYIRTDEEILNEYESLGIHIEDKKEYLNNGK